MKIALYSDLHLELARWEGDSLWEPPQLDVDVVVLAGDIDTRTNGIKWAASAFPDTPVIYVSGNHEFYGHSIHLFYRDRGEQGNVHFLENSTFTLDGVRFLGCTLWSGFELLGKEKAKGYMQIAKFNIADYRAIIGSEGLLLNPLETRERHQQSLKWLEQELAQPFEGKTVVVTHFAPHPLCVAPEHQESILSPYFVNDLRPLMDNTPIALWCFGHTHTNCDFTTVSGCRVISNQRGYPGEWERNGFRPELVIDLGRVSDSGC
ncbi:hypothetical protein AGMMS49960_14710 [Betaproteobacteria bacterium]|nr:hypothetical protein AGMMS49543_20020 [Betaproteobacteria bacterium]GHU02439.1 hypothetical protein AGMMS49960_14710 [Betaproteobacteria bacterium]GHU22080.1 hypothetical protein AGMMS50243_20960 [Betaproteobacteria bacterium]